MKRKKVRKQKKIKRKKKTRGNERMNVKHWTLNGKRNELRKRFLGDDNDDDDNDGDDDDDGDDNDDDNDDNGVYVIKSRGEKKKVDAGLSKSHWSSSYAHLSSH